MKTFLLVGALVILAHPKIGFLVIVARFFSRAPKIPIVLLGFVTSEIARRDTRRHDSQYYMQVEKVDCLHLIIVLFTRLCSEWFYHMEFENIVQDNDGVWSLIWKFNSNSVVLKTKCVYVQKDFAARLLLFLKTSTNFTNKTQDFQPSYLRTKKVHSKFSDRKSLRKSLRNTSANSPNRKNDRKCHYIRIVVFKPKYWPHTLRV